MPEDGNGSVAGENGPKYSPCDGKKVKVEERFFKVTLLMKRADST